MTRLLLDHPWPLDAATDAGSGGYQVLSKFIDLVRSSGLSPVRFIDRQAHSEALQRLKGRGPWAAAVRRFLPQCIRDDDGGALATPITNKPDPDPPFSVCWKRGLRDQLEDPTNWRNPQIIVPDTRREFWPHTDEVPIRCDDRPEMPSLHRVLAPLELKHYESHPFAVPDLDPWRHLEKLWPPNPGARNSYPCWLPKPPILDQVPVEQLSERLEEARRQGWQVNGRYYFIPPADCCPEQIGKTDWRKGYAFAREKVDGWKGPCPIDYKGRIWRWDMGHRHWDVQLDPYVSISHDGRRL